MTRKKKTTAKKPTPPRNVKAKQGVPPPKTKKPSKFTHSAATLKKLESARMRLRERSGSPGRTSSIEAWIRMNEAGKAAIEQWLDMCLEGDSDWSARRMALDLSENFDYPFSIKSNGSFAAHLRAVYGERYDLAIEMAAKTRSERS